MDGSILMWRVYDRVKGHFFLNASFGVETCSLDAAFVFATNRNRRGDSVFNGECCKSGHLWRFQTSRSVVSCGKRGTWWHSNMFHDVKNRVWQARYFCEVFNKWIPFLEAGTSVVSCCVFFANRIVRAVSSGDNVQVAWHAWHFLWLCDEKLTEASHETSIRGSRSWGSWGKFAGKCRFCTCKVWTFAEVSYDMVVLSFLHASSRFSSSIVAVVSRGCNTVWHVLHGRRGTSWHSHVSLKMSRVVLCGKCNTFVTFSEDDFHFAWQAQHFRRVVLRVFCKSHCQSCVKRWRRCKWPVRCGGSWGCHFAWQVQYLVMF